MKQKKIEHISHDISVDMILKCLWAIRENNQFYFNSYGKEMIENCINQRVKKKLEQIKNCDHLSTISQDGNNYECKVCGLTANVLQLTDSFCFSQKFWLGAVMLVCRNVREAVVLINLNF